MFEPDLLEKFKRIFNLNKTTFDNHGDPSDIHSDSKQQECLFIQVTDCKSVIKNGQAVMRVTGKGTVFGQNEKLPFGYFSKSIERANPQDTQSLFFYDLEQHTPLLLNISQRTFSFIYLFQAQYDPRLGVINQLQVES